MTDLKYRHRKYLVSFIYRDPTERHRAIILLPLCAQQRAMQV